MPRGKFITLEGGEGAGKSTQARMLAEWLRGKGVEAVQTREVGGCPTAEAIRELWLKPAAGVWDPLTELFLIFAARREHLQKTVIPALARGAWVVCDRFTDSTRAYQGAALGLGIDRVDNMYKQINDFEPDLTLLLDLPAEQGLARMKSRDGPDDRYQQQDIAFHRKLRDAYLDLAKTRAERFAVIDAGQGTEAVAQAVQAAVERRLG